jgi:hypothetical protein
MAIIVQTRDISLSWALEIDKLVNRSRSALNLLKTNWRVGRRAPELNRVGFGAAELHAQAECRLFIHPLRMLMYATLPARGASSRSDLQ